jgi:L-amino acid N-acyltransferase YncA
MIREMTQQDSARVLEIYKMGLDTQNATFETEVPSWADWDENHEFRIVGILEKIAKLNGKWRDSLLLERRSQRQKFKWTKCYLVTGQSSSLL